MTKQSTFSYPQESKGEGRRLCILQVSTCDFNGGAEKVAWDLFRSYRSLGHGSWLAVGQKRGDDPSAVAIPRIDHKNHWSRLWLDLEKRLRPSEQQHRHLLWRIGAAGLRSLANPRHELEGWLGVEDFHYPGTKQLLNLVSPKPDIIHCHNLHGAYFDLRALPRLSRQFPLILTLHDAWLLSGHCAHSFDCERWKSGCGECPDITTYPAISRDATAYNWRRKRAIFAKSRLNVATPCRWLMRKVEQSMLAPAMAQSRIIPYGIDLSVFRPAAKEPARAALGLPQDTSIILFTANGIRRNVFKDYQTMREAIARVAVHSNRRLTFVAVGENGPVERIGEAEIRFIPYQKDPAVVARYYHAGDVYLHAAKADTFPNTVLEALACGTPVVATAVGGIPEQIKALNLSGFQAQDATTYPMHEATGILTPPGNAESIAVGIKTLLSERTVRERLGQNAARDAQERFDLRCEVETYLDWYQELLYATPMQRVQV